ncbi:DNA polymerase epsilon subunit B [Colletotrichum spaethianum]|uniref:DNA polymerase epsilon subunit B n=1 Tax=Colletotrichum spaethianum TaxID=700344 RepID=A0AA37PDV7_9PEZI|nr:DNA polymerase epsilon subunit B [Colletotrichum spaethianum]GKT50404.1 DNA polymerase epsilon subunit B [Colletotrichum spaethianum]
MLLGMLNVLPAGGLAISDLTATIALDVSQAVAIPEDSAWFAPGMIVLVDGVYEEEEESVGKGLSGSSGVGGTLGGRFQGFFIGQPPCEKRKATLGVSGPDGGQDHTIGGGFGWIDFLGVGSERAVGSKMRKLEQRLLPRHSAEEVPSRGRMVILGELNLDQPRTLQALRRILTIYAAEPEGASPMSFVITGNFTQHAVLARGGSGGSIEYKEYFDALASTLSDFPTLLQTSTFIFVPGDNDAWVSSFTAGAATRYLGKEPQTRVTLFGPNHEVVVFRDDISARLRRAAVRLKTSKQPQNEDEENQPPETEDGADDVVMGGNDPVEEEEAMDVDIPRKKPTVKQVNSSVPQDVHTARKLVKTVLDQGYLSPFRQSIRPVHWDYATALHLYPLPTSMVLVDTTAPPFCVTYEGCHVMNPGSILVPGRTRVGRWIEYEIGKIGKLRETTF